MTSATSPSESKRLYIEIVAGVSTFLTLLYVFILNPILLARTGIDISAAFFATIISSAGATLLMGVWARVPFAVAPAPSITTFFVSFVCIQLGLSWQTAMAAVILSGFLSIAMTALSVRQQLIASIPVPLRVCIVFAVSGFLVANGLNQAKIITFSGGLIDSSSVVFSRFTSSSALVLYVGLVTTLLVRRITTAAPLVGILVASLAASVLGIKTTSAAELSPAMWSAVGQADFHGLLDLRVAVSMLLLFVIDFFGGVGKYVGLFQAMGQKKDQIDDAGLGRSLYVDGAGNIIGGLVGASSLAVFISSAVGIAAGGRTGLTAITTAVCMLASLLLIPLVGVVPVEATAGILIYVAFILLPLDEILGRNGRENEHSLRGVDLAVGVSIGVISFLTFGIDKAILAAFLFYTAQIVWHGAKRGHIVLILTTCLLLVSVVAQLFLQR